MANPDPRQPSSLSGSALLRAATLTLAGFGIQAISGFRGPLLLIPTAVLAVYIVVLLLGVMVQRTSGAIRSPAPSWPRRFRWMLLAGIPASVATASSSYISTDLSPIPLFWLVPQYSLLVAWALAYAHRGPSSRLTWGIALASMVPYAALALVLVRDLPLWSGSAWALLLMGGAVLIPHRWTRLGQIVIATAVSLQIYQVGWDNFEGNVAWAIAVHIAFGVITGWGCFGAAVEDAPADDRMLEFVLTLLGGSLVCTFLAAILAPLAFSEFIWEYPVVIVASVLIRFWPRPTDPAGTRFIEHSEEHSESIQAMQHP